VPVFGFFEGWAFDFVFSCSSRTHRNHSTALIAIQRSFSTFRCKTLNIFIKVCYPPSVFGDQNPRSITSVARRPSAVLPPPSLASSPPRLLLHTVSWPINHAESTLLQVLILKQLKVPLESITFEKPGEGPPLWLTKYDKKVSARRFAGIPISHLPYTLPSSVCCNSFICHSLVLNAAEGYENTRGCGAILPISEHAASRTVD
jgi:hypothetical protein